MKSIYNKIVVSSLGGIGSVLLVTTAVTFIFSDDMISSFLKQGDQTTNEFINDFRSTSNQTEKTIVNIYEDQVKKKANRLIEKDRMALTTPFVDNQILFIQNFIVKSLSLDPDIVFASFYVLEDEEIRAIKVSSSQYPEGNSSNVSYDNDSNAWVSESFSLKDPGIEKLLEIDSPIVEPIKYQLIDSRGIERVIDAYNVVVPIVEGEFDEIPELKEEGESIGFLRYVISLEQTARVVSKTKKDFNAVIMKQEARVETIRKRIVLLGEDNKSKITTTLLISSICLVLGGLLLSTFIAKKISGPIISLTEAASEIGRGNYETPVKTTSEDEVGRLCTIFDEMRTKVKDFTENLQLLVDQRTNEIRFLLDNVDLAIFKVLPDFALGSEYSKSAKIMFGDLKKKSTRDIFNGLDSSRTPDILDSIIDTDEFTYDANAIHLPTELKSDSHFFELSYSPHYEQDGSLSSILVTIKDVTELNKLREEAQNEAKKGKFVLNIASRGPHKIRWFLDNEIKALNSIKTSDKVLKALHTAKGNSSSYGFAEIAKNIHDFENHLSEVSKEDFEHHSLKYVDKAVQLYQQALKSVNGFFPTNDGFNLVKEPIVYYRDLLKVSKGSDSLIELKELFYQKSYIALKDLSSQLLNKMEKTCEHLGKPSPHLEVSCDAYLNRNYEYMLLGVMTHILRNSLDHGIELPNVRTQLGKKPQGKISISSQVNQEFLFIHYFDDGAGINLKKISEKNEAPNDMSIGDIANLIFQSGFSTKDHATSISGRGVGMDAVKSTLQEYGGDIQISLLSVSSENMTLQELNQDYCPFQFEIKLPTELFEQSESNDLLAAS